ncbi:hypothetical protein Ddye_011589 [Dipteronia dyeriana]|uniref:Uncharacterized protein n=1 Tax=Dipteronia dyeriana TaxID=168575 RepID=A0AAE0CID1_9ROSI|nr:hypothetical protein Ddye_011589 [Dipteronia dyeriana]
MKERDGLISQVAMMVEEKQKLLAGNSKLLERAEQQVAELEKLKGILKLHLEEFKSDFESARDEIGIRSVDLFKHSPSFDAYTHREFARGVDACKNLVRALDYPEVTKKIEESLKENLEKMVEDLKAQVHRWEMDRKNRHLPLLDMHVDLDARSDCTFGIVRLVNIWLDSLIDYGPDPESEEDESEETGEGEIEG